VEELKRIGARQTVPALPIETLAKADLSLAQMLEEKRAAEIGLAQAQAGTSPGRLQFFQMELENTAKAISKRYESLLKVRNAGLGVESPIEQDVSINDPILFYTDPDAATAHAVCITREPRLGNLVLRYAHRSNNEAGGTILPQAPPPADLDGIWSQSLSINNLQISAARIAPGRFHISIMIPTSSGAVPSVPIE
jgi:hypothetical protein